MTKRPAIFFDRDNTLIVSNGYLGDPSQVTLVEGAAEAVARARMLGYVVVTISNQSGVARGLFTEDDVQAVNRRLDELLQSIKPTAAVARHEYCPFHPEGTVERYRQDSDLRKPRPGMLLRAAEALGLDLSRSWMIGDTPRDIEAGKAAGCRTILFTAPGLPPSPDAEAAGDDGEASRPDFVASSLKEALDIVGRELLRKSTAPAATAPPATAPVAAAEATAAATPPAPEPAPAPAPEPEPAPAPASDDAPQPAAAPAEPEAVPAPKPEPGTVPTLAVGPTFEASPDEAFPRLPDPLEPAPSPEPAPAKATAAEPLHARRPAPAPHPEPAPAKAAPPAAASAPRDDGRLETLVNELLQEVRRRNDAAAPDFSVSKLLAGITQALSLAILFIAYLNRADGTVALHAILYAIFFQVFTIALLIMGRQR